ncbi:MAG: ATP-binding protein [Coleofasciculus sp. B1-GNL1-01]|uniref:ATP-binding protein n=1 Tax=Coleofasciculus sp. B1-GNL1-01 TaxID=3068484 RepID=UPI0033042DFD
MENISAKILLIEDDQDDAFLLKRLLQKAQYLTVDIEQAETLQQAINYLRQQSYDIILLDLFLPETQGLDTFFSLSSHYPDIPIIVLSGLADQDIALAAVQAGAQDYLVKGQFDSHLLSRSIRYGIERQHLSLRLKQQNQELQAKEAQLRTIISQNADGMVMINPQGIVVFANPAAESLLGCPANQLNAAVLGFPFTHQETTELTIQQPSGDSVIVEMRLVQMNWNSESAYLASLRDITPRKQAEESLRRALDTEKHLNQLKSQIISVVSHEYRTPLTVILSSAEMLSRYRQRLSDVKQEQHLGRIKSAVEHLTALVDDVLFISKAELNKLEFKPEPIEIIPFTQELVSQVQVGQEDNYRLVFSNQGNGNQLNGDAKLLRQIITNLVSNAIKYSPDGGNVGVHLTCEDSQIILQVSDSGIGIPPEDQARLFQSFNRASNVGAISGTGLGLSIVKKCVELHRGEITLTSAVGVGTTFTVTLPKGF